MGKKIRFSLHAEDKLKRLKKVGVTKGKVLATVRNPEKAVDGYYERRIAQRSLISE